MTIATEYLDFREINLEDPCITGRRGDENQERAPTSEEGVRLIKDDEARDVQPAP
jgi:hypothetical protein